MSLLTMRNAPLFVANVTVRRRLPMIAAGGLFYHAVGWACDGLSMRRRGGQATYERTAVGTSSSRRSTAAAPRHISTVARLSGSSRSQYLPARHYSRDDWTRFAEGSGYAPHRPAEDTSQAEGQGLLRRCGCRRSVSPRLVPPTAPALHPPAPSYPTLGQRPTPGSGVPAPSLGHRVRRGG